MVAMLRCFEATLFVGEQGLNLNVERSTHTILGNVCAAERKQLLFDEAELTSLFLHKQCSS